MKPIFLGLLIASTLAGGFTPLSPKVDSHPDTAAPQLPPAETSAENEMPPINMTIEDNVFSIQLYDTPAAKALLEQLPLTITMDELNGNEKFYYLTQPLPTAPGNPGEIHVGDLMLYGDNCLVLFYESFPTSYRYTALGRVENPNDLAHALAKNSVTVYLQVGE